MPVFLKILRKSKQCLLGQGAESIGLKDFEHEKDGDI